MLAMIVGLLTVIFFGYALYPRHPDLRAFDPAAMARSETAMWQHYYERRYLLLFFDLYENARTQYGFSPWDSVRIAVMAVRAANAFQTSASRSGAQAALPFLEDYFGLLARATPVPLDIKAAARAELDWWQAPRGHRSKSLRCDDCACVLPSIWARQRNAPRGRDSKSGGDGFS